MRYYPTYYGQYYGVTTIDIWSAPEISESIEPERISLSLQIEKNSDKHATRKTVDKKATIKTGGKKTTIKTTLQIKTIIIHITDHVEAKASEIANLLNLKPTRVKELLSEMIIDGIIVAEGANTGTEFTN